MVVAWSIGVGIPSGVNDSLRDQFRAALARELDNHYSRFDAWD
tara:strand:+ start:2822 stop:2950 length:129 start_codon:yes stop_codon:yes gene_type:complete